MFEFELMGQTYSQVTDLDATIWRGDLIYFFDEKPDRDAICYMLVAVENGWGTLNWIGYKAGAWGPGFVPKTAFIPGTQSLKLRWFKDNMPDVFWDFLFEKTKFLQRKRGN